MVASSKSNLSSPKEIYTRARPSRGAVPLLLLLLSLLLLHVACCILQLLQFACFKLHFSFADAGCVSCKGTVNECKLYTDT